MDTEVAVLSVSTNSWETGAVNEWMVGKESYWYTYSIWIEVLALSAYARPFNTQDIKRCSVDWCSCINTSVNNAESYIVTFFNYTEDFSLLKLTALALTGFQELCEACHLLECPFNSWRVLYQTIKVFLSHTLFIHITMLIHRYYFYESERKVYHNPLKTSTHIFFWIQWYQTTKIMATKRGVLDTFQA